MAGAAAAAAPAAPAQALAFLKTNRDSDPGTSLQCDFTSKVNNTGLGVRLRVGAWLPVGVAAACRPGHSDSDDAEWPRRP